MDYLQGRKEEEIGLTPYGVWASPEKKKKRAT